MNTGGYLYVVNSIGVILALGHFFFGYLYDGRRYSFKKTSLLFSTAFLLSFTWYLLFRYVVQPNGIFWFNASVIGLFVLHNWYDIWRFDYKKVAWLCLIYGIVASIFFILVSQNNRAGYIATTLVWMLVFLHYFFWMFISIRKYDEQKSRRFIQELIAFHVSISIVFVWNLDAGVSLLDAFFSLSFFYFMTLVHIIFSAFRQLTIILGRNELSKPRAYSQMAK